MSAKNIIRFLSKAHISFSSVDMRSAGACEFYRQIGANKTKLVNPKCDIKYECTRLGTDPTIKLDFINGRKETLVVPNTDILDIYEDVDFFCSQIESELEAQGKSIDDL